MRQEKQLLLDEIKDQIEQFQFLCHHAAMQGLTANKANEFRREIAKIGGNVEVVANGFGQSCRRCRRQT